MRTFDSIRAADVTMQPDSLLSGEPLIAPPPILDHAAPTLPNTVTPKGEPSPGPAGSYPHGLRVLVVDDNKIALAGAFFYFLLMVVPADSNMSADASC